MTKYFIAKKSIEWKGEICADFTIENEKGSEGKIQQQSHTKNAIIISYNYQVGSGQRSQVHCFYLNHFPM